jgi:hypothetical protein
MQKWYLLKLFLEWKKGGIKESSGLDGDNMTYMIYYKTFCKCHNVHPPSTVIKEKRNFENKNILNSHMCITQLNVEKLSFTPTLISGMLNKFIV